MITLSIDLQKNLIKITNQEVPADKQEKIKATGTEVYSGKSPISGNVEVATFLMSYDPEGFVLNLVDRAGNVFSTELVG